MDRSGLSLQPFHIPTSCRQPRSQGSRSRPCPSRGCKEGRLSAITSMCDNATDSPATAQAEENIFAAQCSIALDAGQLQGAEVEPAAKNSLLVTNNSSAWVDPVRNLSQFDYDLTFPDNSIRKMRRMKIMRHLGLTAPVGSPFTRPPGRRSSTSKASSA
ncbi:hypothetical protein Taro_032498 [Colocasia esculenta]|uniref:Uncharacterized protein n=1 Tax=Colocasia esculenta TaxID=4460 RepID=A0A843VLH5_COLES|nr:hypothetical protein [Colocasia esculenta]